ncbi:MAG: DNA repair protein RecO [Salibacteraceae bacterium]
MIQNTRGIVLHKTNFSETSLVVQVYSMHFGRISLLIHGAKKKKSRNKSAHFEPLSIIEISGNFSNTEKLIRPSEVKSYIPLINIQTQLSKRLIALFLAEVIHRSIKESYQEIDLYNFIEKSLFQLENSSDNVANFHLVFLLKLCRFLGIYPLLGQGEYFSISEGVFLNSVPTNGVYLNGDEKNVFYSLLGTNIAECHTLSLDKQQRKNALKNILDYYKVHIVGMGEVKSHEVLETIFN